MSSKSDSQNIRHTLAKCLHDELGQHLVGTLLAAKSLADHLDERGLPEASEAAYLVQLLKTANDDINELILKLDVGKPR